MSFPEVKAAGFYRSDKFAAPMKQFWAVAPKTAQQIMRRLWFGVQSPPPPGFRRPKVFKSRLQFAVGAVWWPLVISWSV